MRLGTHEWTTGWVDKLIPKFPSPPPHFIICVIARSTCSINAICLVNSFFFCLVHFKIHPQLEVFPKHLLIYVSGTVLGSLQADRGSCPHSGDGQREQ